MVTGWSYFAGSSGVPASCISCTSAAPLDVTRMETCAVSVFMPGCGGSMVVRPSQSPARVFSWVKDLSASDVVAGWAKARTGRRITPASSIIRNDFIFVLLKISQFPVLEQPLIQVDLSRFRKRNGGIVMYNTMFDTSSFFWHGVHVS